MTFNEWFCSLPEQRQAILRDDKWMLAQAAYKAGERDGRKQVEAVAGNAVGLAILAEREVCANICDHEHGTAGDAADKIRLRSNVTAKGRE